MSTPTPCFREKPKEDGMLFYRASQNIENYNGNYNESFYCPCSICTSPARPGNREASTQSLDAVPRLELPSLRRSPYDSLPPILPDVTILQA
jgi:hypothetical protein